MALEDEAPLRIEIEQMIKANKLVKVELEAKGLDKKSIEKIEDDLASYQEWQKKEKAKEENNG